MSSRRLPQEHRGNSNRDLLKLGLTVIVGALFASTLPSPHTDSSSPPQPRDYRRDLPPSRHSRRYAPRSRRFTFDREYDDYDEDDRRWAEHHRRDYRRTRSSPHDYQQDGDDGYGRYGRRHQYGNGGQHRDRGDFVYMDSNRPRRSLPRLEGPDPEEELLETRYVGEEDGADVYVTDEYLRDLESGIRHDRGRLRESGEADYREDGYPQEYGDGRTTRGNRQRPRRRSDWDR